MAISFSGFDNPFTTGLAIQKSVLENEAQANAYNALKEMYGPQVGNLNWQQAQSAYGAQQKLPGELEQQSLANQQTRQNIDFAAQNQPEKLRGLRLGNDAQQQSLDQSREMQPYKVQGARQATELTQQKIDAGEAEAKDSQAERERNAAQGIFAALKDRIAAGEDPATAFDSIAPQIAAMEGVDPGQLRQIRDAFVRNPRQVMDAFDKHMQTVRPNTDLMRSQAAMARAGAAQAKAAGKAAQGAGTPAAAFTDWSKRDVPNAISTALTDIENNDAGDSALVRSIKRKAWDAGYAISDDDANMRASIEKLRNRIGAHNLQAFRQQGLTFGSITEKEFERIAAAVANLDTRQGPERLKAEIRNIGAAYEAWLRSVEAENPQIRSAAPSPGATQSDTAARRRQLLDKYR